MGPKNRSTSRMRKDDGMTALLTLDPAARRSVLALLGCMAGADGDVSEEESEALAGAAMALGVTDGSILTVPTLDEIDFEGMDRQARLLAYAGAVWMMLADGLTLRRESSLLSHLAERLRVGPDMARFLGSFARWVRTETELPWHREADLLFTEAARRLARVEAHQRAA